MCIISSNNNEQQPILQLLSALKLIENPRRIISFKVSFASFHSNKLKKGKPKINNI